MENTENKKTTESLNFIEQIVEKDLESGKHKTIVTRFPPEPNGYLHIGHAKAICTSFEIAKKYGGRTNLRFDDTNPVKEDVEYVDSIKEDLQWLGYDWEDREYYSSDYFGQLYEFAIKLIKEGKAYVDDSTSEEIAKLKGVPNKPGQDSPYRSRSVEENLELFEGMKAGKYDEGTRVLRAKIDMASPNMHMRDPLMYRILKAEHHRTGNEWCIYPMYDFTHGISDSIEGITHSLCSLEFENHRPLYEWFNKTLGIFEPQQIEFSRLNLSYTVMSKRRLLKLVEDGTVSGWDDPRMPTISGMRRRGYPAESIRNFITKVGNSKRAQMIDLSLLEFFVREELNKTTPRVMGVLDPVKLILTNYPEDLVEVMTAVNNPEDPEAGTRPMPFSKVLYIERGDFMEVAPNKKYHRLAKGKDVRLKNGYIIHCDNFVKDSKTGEITEIHCHYYPDSKSGEDTSGIKAKGTIHWVSAEHAMEVEVRVYDRLFNDPTPNSHKDENGESVPFTDFINPDSFKKITAYVEPSLQFFEEGDQMQFMRKGYFCVDPDSTEDKMVFNQTVALKDGWAKKMEKGQQANQPKNKQGQQQGKQDKKGGQNKGQAQAKSDKNQSQKNQQNGKKQEKQENKQPTNVAKVEAKPEAKVEAKPEAKVEAKSEAKQKTEAPKPNPFVTDKYKNKNNKSSKKKKKKKRR